MAPWLREHALNMLKDGYAVIENAVLEKIVDVALTTFAEWKERNRQCFLPEIYKQGCSLDRVVNFQNVFDEFKALFACGQSLVLQDYLFDSPATCYTSLFFEAATQQAIHRDITYFWTYPTYIYFGMWTALDEVALEHGLLTVVPGNHRIGDIDRSRIVRDKYSRKSVPRRDRDLAVEYQRLLLERCDDMGLQPKQLPVPKGAMIVWHPLLAHGGAAVLDLQKSRLFSWFMRLRNMGRFISMMYSFSLISPLRKGLHGHIRITLAALLRKLEIFQSGIKYPVMTFSRSSNLQFF